MLHHFRRRPHLLLPFRFNRSFPATAAAAFGGAPYRLLHTEADEGKSHYDILGLPFGAGGTEIKRRFYELSKKHHPDRNPGDPTASARFVEISHAYSVLSNPSSRAAYDKTLQSVLRHNASHGSSSAYGPAGGRPASGLSRRRTKAQGPPPSYFRDQSFAGARGKQQYQRAGPWTADGWAGGGGFGPGDAQQQGRNHDVPHFNWDEKYRQHHDYEQRRQRAAMQAEMRFGRGGQFHDFSNQSGFWLQATVIGGCVLLVGVIGGMIAGRRDRKRFPPERE